MSTPSLGRVLIIAGSDSGGGAGIQADIKTVTALGGYAATAVTAVTAQNSLGVQAVERIKPKLVALQARAVLSDIGADAIKTGMLGGRKLVETVAALLDEAGVPAIVDPVMLAKSGAALLKPGAVAAVKALLIVVAVVAASIPLALAAELDQSPTSTNSPQHLHNIRGNGSKYHFFSLRPFETLRPESRLPGSESSGYRFSYGGSYQSSTSKLKYRRPRPLYLHH